jgi:CPA2 family monovalent cation:H+ antiporter-2
MVSGYAFSSLVLASGAGELHTALTGMVALFGSALVVAWLARAARLPTILGFLLAGILIGPSALDLIHHDEVLFLAELGLTLLLFTVGLELSPAPLLRMGARLLVAASLQIVSTTAAVGVALHLLLAVDWPIALILGLAAALSSTAIVLKHLADRGQIDTPAGSLTTGILLIQDVVVILVLILLPFLPLGGGVARPWYFLIGKLALALGGLVVVTLVARRLVPIVTHHVLRFGGQELMTLLAIAMAATGAWLASLAGWSWPLGAFIAGLLLAQTDVRHQLAAEITPFRDALNALFFISIGMLVELGVVAQYALPLTLAVVATLVVKTLLVASAAKAAGWSLRLALTAGIGLSTMSEFGYVLVNEAARREVPIEPELLTLFVAWAVGTMLVGAVLVPAAGPVAAAVATRLQRSVAPTDDVPHDAIPPGQHHVVIVGYGINGRNVANVLRATGILYSIIEMQPAGAQRARREHPDRTVLVGDAVRQSILAHAHLASARALVVSIADVEATRRIVAQAHRMVPEVFILARTRYVSEVEPLYRLGARLVIPEEFETSIEIFAHLLQEFGVPQNVIEQQVALVRSGHYGMLRGLPTGRVQRAAWLEALERTVTVTFLVQDDSPACGQTLRALDLRARTGVTVIAVTRAGRPIANPPPDFALVEGDVLVLVGPHRALDEARQSLSAADA